LASIRSILTWAALGAAVIIPIGIAATSPLLAWRDPVYIAAGLAGVIAMALVLVQPLLAGGYLPGLASPRGRLVHRWVGLVLVAAVVLHVGGLWLTSPPDVIDALLFVSPTPFAAWGVIAMWAVFAAALLAAARQRLRIRPQLWRFCHTALAVIVVAGSVVHALLIEGTMETWSKTVLCALAIAATIKVLIDLRSWALLRRRRVE
jgi:predicted ferric reductase